MQVAVAVDGVEHDIRLEATDVIDHGLDIAGAQRQVAFAQHRGAVGIGQIANGLLHLAAIGASLQPQRQVVHARVIAQAREVAAVHHHRANLPCIVAPDTGYKKARLLYARTGLRSQR